MKSGCVVWNRGLTDDGYGYFKRDGKVVSAHRHFYEKKHGPVPAGLELDHTCRNRSCINPDHLEPVTHIENCRRGALVTVMNLERAREMRALRASGASYAACAKHFGISESLTAQILTNRCWRDAAAPRERRRT